MFVGFALFCRLQEPSYLHSISLHTGCLRTGWRVRSVCILKTLINANDRWYCSMSWISLFIVTIETSNGSPEAPGLVIRPDYQTLPYGACGRGCCCLVETCGVRSPFLALRPRPRNLFCCTTYPSHGNRPLHRPLPLRRQDALDPIHLPIGSTSEPPVLIHRLRQREMVR